MTDEKTLDVRSPDEERLRERIALAEADGRREYSMAELVEAHNAGADMPYNDVRELGDRPQDVAPITDAAVEEAQAAQAEQQPTKEHVVQDLSAQRTALEVERDAVQSKLDAEHDAEAERRAELETQRDELNKQLAEFDG